MKIRMTGWALTVAGAIGIAIVAATAPAAAEPGAVDPPLLTLGIDQQFVPKTASDESPTLTSCGGIPGGARADTDGWVFDQPIVGAEVGGYAIGFISESTTSPTGVVIGITVDGVIPIPLSDDPPPPLPDGTAGGLLNGGADGAWLQTPAGWRLVAGNLFVLAASGPSTFSLTAVCRPPATTTPAVTTPPVTASTSGAPPQTGSTTPGRHGQGGELPVTGFSAGGSAGAGVLLLVSGVVLLLLIRRRDRAVRRPRPQSGPET